MKKLLIGLTFLVSMSSFANIPQEIKDYMNKDGVFVSNYNGDESHDTGGGCKVTMNPYGGDLSISIESNSYSDAVAHLENSTRSEDRNTISYKLAASGERPGGSVCGDWDILLSYKKYLILDGNSLSIEESYRCLTGGRNVLTQICTID